MGKQTAPFNNVRATPSVLAAVICGSSSATESATRVKRGFFVTPGTVNGTKFADMMGEWKEGSFILFLVAFFEKFKRNQKEKNQGLSNKEDRKKNPNGWPHREGIVRDFESTSY